MLTVVFALLGWTTLAAEPASIQYRLREPGRVSLAIYDKDGSQVRTLRNAEPQRAGRHAIAWDGLDQTGQPVIAGTYTWKLLQGQGLRAEYLFSLGTSTREQPWPGNHSGPTGLAVDGDGVHVLGTAAEGCVQLLKMSQAGEIRWAAEPYGYNTDDIAQAGNLVYLASTQAGCLIIVNAATGERVWWTLGSKGVIPTVATVKRFRFASAETTEAGWTTAPALAYTADRGWGWERVDGLTTTPSAIRRSADPASGTLRVFRTNVPFSGAWNWCGARVTLHNRQDHPIVVKLLFGIAHGNLIPNRDLTLQPKETVTADVDQLVVNWSSAGQFVMGVDGDAGWELQRLEIIAPADRVAALRQEFLPGHIPEPWESNTPTWAASRNEVWMGNRAAECIQQIEPRMNGKVLREIAVPDFQDLAFTKDGQLLVISGNSVCLVLSDSMQPVIQNLDDPRRLAVDQATGDVLVVEWGKHHQVRRYDAAYKFQRVFGREGGRRYGLYRPEDFYRVDDVAGDGRGGCFIVENWGARRTAHFTAQGKLLREWYGGQGFQQWVTQDARHANRFWLPGTFNSDLIECEVDWAKGDWRVRAVYDIQGVLEKTLGGLLYVPAGYISARMHTADRDLDGDRKAERLLWVEDYPGLLLRIDEPGGRLVPLAAAGFLQDSEVRLLQTGKPTESDKARYAPLLQAYERYPKNTVTPRYWTWADADGDGLMQAAELRLFSGDYANGTYIGGYYGAVQLNADLSLWQRSGWSMPPDGPSYYLMQADGYTSCGAPLWRYDTRVPSVARDRDGRLQHAVVAADGAAYEVNHSNGEGYRANGVSSTGGHGHSWPATLIGGTRFVSRRPDGQVRWRVGNHAALKEGDPGQLHAPLRVAGFVKDCVGVADRIGNPLAVWTTDGLYVGNLFDRRADDGLPARVYSWFQYNGPLPPRGGAERGHAFDRAGLCQYDMLSNGTLGTAPNGDVFYMACGPNNVPTYRIKGWNELKRQQGKIVLRRPPEKPAENGTGLSATYYPLPNFEGQPTRRIDPQLWFGGKTSALFKPWPHAPITSNTFSAVWDGELQPRFTEPARLLVYVDHGEQNNEPPPHRVRLWVNGKRELDYWEQRDWDQVHLRTRPFDWKAGERVALRLEYSCRKPADELSLCWESPSIEVEHVPPGCLYPRDP